MERLMPDDHLFTALTTTKISYRPTTIAMCYRPTMITLSDHATATTISYCPDYDDDRVVLDHKDNLLLPDRNDELFRARTATEPRERQQAVWDWAERTAAVAIVRHARRNRAAKQRPWQALSEEEFIVGTPLDILKKLLHDGYPKEVTTGLPPIVRNGRPRYTRRQQEGISSCIWWARKCWIRDGRKNANHHAAIASKSLFESYNVNMSPVTVRDRMTRR
jgi:hypothetical protein